MRWLDFGARNRLSDKGCHPFYEFPYDTAKICSFSLFAKPVLINFKKVYHNGYSIFKFSHFYCIISQKTISTQKLSISNEMLNFCSLCVAELYERGGISY